MTEPFVLDRDDNPHPRMLERAISRRRLAHLSGDVMLGREWLVCLETMCDATGLPAEEIDAWVASHDDVDTAALTPATRTERDTVPVKLGTKP